MKNFTQLFYVALISFALFSCAENTEIERIPVDFTNVKTMTMDDANIIHLETSDNSLLYDLCAIEIVDDKFFIFSRNVVKAFDKEGRYLFDLGQKGQGPKDHTTVTYFFSDGKKLSIYDFNIKKVLNYNSDGDFMDVVPIKVQEGLSAPVKILHFDDQSFVCQNCYVGGRDTNMEALSRWNSDFTKGKVIKGRTLTTGLRLPDACHIDENKRILYWEPVKDTLFAVKEEVLQPLYKIDFGAHAMPEDIMCRDDYDRVMLAGKEENYKYAGVARYYQVHNDKIFFTCIFKEKVYLCAYDEKTKKTMVITIGGKDEQYRLCPFFKIHQDTLYMEMQNMKDIEQNHFLYKLPISEI